MNSKEALEELSSMIDLDFYSLEEIDKLTTIIEKDLKILNDLTNVLKKCTYATRIEYDGIHPEIFVGEEFDKKLFKSLLDRLGFEIKEKENKNE